MDIIRVAFNSEICCLMTFVAVNNKDSLLSPLFH